MLSRLLFTSTNGGPAPSRLYPRGSHEVIPSREAACILMRGHGLLGRTCGHRIGSICRRQYGGDGCRCLTGAMVAVTVAPVSFSVLLLTGLTGEGGSGSV